jgi:hypothetical protein
MPDARDATLRDPPTLVGAGCEFRCPSMGRTSTRRIIDAAACVYSLEEPGTCQLYSPDRAARIEWAL